MADGNTGALDTIVQEKLDGDEDFQKSIAEMSDEDKQVAINEKSQEIVNTEITRLQGLEKEAGENKALVDDLKERLARANESRGKLEEEMKELKKGKGEGGGAPQPSPDLSSDDLYALVEAKVPKEDIEEVKKAATLLNKSIAEALNDSMVQNILKQRQEERAAETAKNENETRRPGETEVTDAEILRRHREEGFNPEPGSKEADQLFWAKRRAEQSQRPEIPGRQQ